MLKKRVIPCLLLHDGGLVKTEKFRNPTYVGDPINAVKIFNDKYVDEIIFLDIDASKEGRGPDFEHIADICSECFIPFCYGGGVRSIEDAERLFNIGVEKIAVNSAGLKDISLISELAAHFGSQSIVGAVDVKRSWTGKHCVVDSSTGKKFKKDLQQHLKELEGAGAGELLVNCIDCDGVMQGYDNKLFEQLAAVVNIPLIACGGAGELADIQLLFEQTDVAAAAAGSMFVFKGKHKAVLINYPQYSELKRITGYQ